MQLDVDAVGAAQVNGGWVVRWFSLHSEGIARSPTDLT